MKELADIAKKILSSTTKVEEIECGKLLERFLTDLSDQGPVRASRGNIAESLTPGGVALSPAGAADCLKEYYRTVRFLKGTYQAIQVLLNRFPGEEIHVLYAGCGPFATILLPILPLLAADRVKVTLLDIHDYSVGHATQLISILGLDSYIKKAVVADATLYQKDEEEHLHLIVSETMFKALTREPQFAITANLAPQLVDGGLLIPEEIKVEAGFSFFGNEPYYQFDSVLNTAEGVHIKFPSRTILGTVLCVGKETRIEATESAIETEVFQTPVIPDSERPDLCLFTTVRIFGDIVLRSTESTITNPHPVCAIANRYDDRSFRLIYQARGIPDWKFAHMNGEER